MAIDIQNLKLYGADITVSWCNDFLVSIAFRRPVDNEVAEEILALSQEMFAVEDFRAKSKEERKWESGDFKIKCIGVDAFEVAETIAKHLECSHGISVRRLVEQRISGIDVVPVKDFSNYQQSGIPGRASTGLWDSPLWVGWG